MADDKKDSRKIKKAIKATKAGKFGKAKRKLSQVSAGNRKAKSAAAFVRREEQKSKPSQTAKVRTSLPLYKTEYN